MNIIVAVSANWGIGYEDQLLFHIREDQQFFRTMTLGKVVVYGRTTLASFRDAKPLPDRTNIVLSRNPELVIPGVTICHSIPQLSELLKLYPTEDVFIIGGESVYAQFLNACTTAYITKIDVAPPADTFFPNLDALPSWRLVDESEAKMDKKGRMYRFCTYGK